MFLFGWGTKNKTWFIDDARSLIVVWKYFHIFFFPVAYDVKWHLIGDARSEDRVISEEELKKLFPVNRPNISIWYRFGLLIGIAAIIIIGLIS